MNLSIIIPIYNSEIYLERCIDSLFSHNENIFNYEVILVNDGSTDNSLEICNKFAYKNDNIHIINITNSGPATAKNKGLEIASGDYVSFIDSDDEVMPDMFSIMLDNAYKNNSDIVCCSYIQIDEQGNKSHEECSDKDYIFNKTEAMKHLLDKDMIYSQCWTKIYKRKVLTDNNIKFIDGLKTEEDFLFNLYSFLHSNTVTIIDKPLYIYRYHSSSLSRLYHKEHILQFMKNMSFRLELTQKEINKSIPELMNSCTIHCMKYYNLLIGRSSNFQYYDVKDYFNPAHLYIKKNALLLIKEHSNIGMSIYGAIIALLLPHKLYHFYRMTKF